MTSFIILIAFVVAMVYMLDLWTGDPRDPAPQPPEKHVENSPVFMLDKVNGYEVSTTDLGTAVEPELRYETMVFRRVVYKDHPYREELEGYTRRYGDITEAARGHGEVVAELQGPFHIGGMA